MTKLAKILKKLNSLLLLKPIRFLTRLFNIMEPDVGYPILSISKLSMWATLCLTIYMGIKNPGSPELAAALGAQMVATANYGFRRWVQMKTGKGSYGPSVSASAEDAKIAEPVAEPVIEEEPKEA